MVIFLLYMQKLSIIKQTTQPLESGVEGWNGSRGVSRNDIVFCIHMGWCIFYVQNQGGFLTFNFKSVYSAAVLRADKIS